MRLHGCRIPEQPQVGTTGGAQCRSGAANEVWSFGEEAYEILKKYLFLREEMRPYIRTLMVTASEKGTPIMRPLFYDYPKDDNAWKVEDVYMFGPDVLVAPILELGMRKRNVYLPKGNGWKNIWNDIVYEGGQVVEADAPLDKKPVFV